MKNIENRVFFFNFCLLLGTIFIVFINKNFAQDCKRYLIDIKEASKVSSKNPEKIKNVIEEFGNCLKESNIKDTLLQRYYSAKITFFLKQFQLDSAEHYIKLSEKLSQNINIPNKKLIVDFEWALLYQKRKEHIKAIQKYQKILVDLEKINDKMLEGKALHNLSSIYIELYQHEAAISYILKAKNIIKDSNEEIAKAKICVQLSELYMFLERWKEAEQEMKEAIISFEKINLKDYVGASKIGLAVLYLKQNKKIENLDTLLEYLPFIQKGGAGKLTKITAEIDLATLLIQKSQNYEFAQQLLDKNLPICEKLQLKSLIANIFYAYASLYKIKNNTQNMYEYYEKYIDQQNQITREGMKLQLNGLKIIHELEQKEKTIEQLKQKQNIYFLWLVILILSILFFGLSILLARQRLKNIHNKLKNQTLALENEKLLNEKLIFENSHKDRELTTNSLQIIQKNELLEKINIEISPLLRQENISEEAKKSLHDLRKSIKENDFFEVSWETFRQHFEDVHPLFFEKLKTIAPKLTHNDLRHCAYLKMGLSRKEISQLTKVNVEAVKVARNRLKKKLGLSADIDIQVFLQKIGG